LPRYEKHSKEVAGDAFASRLVQVQLRRLHHRELNDRQMETCICLPTSGWIDVGE
jgi:hypothetical protein